MRYYLFFMGLLGTLLFCQKQLMEVWDVDPLKAVYPDLNTIENYQINWLAGFPVGIGTDVQVVVKMEVGELIYFSKAEEITINEDKILTLEGSVKQFGTSRLGNTWPEV